MEIDVRQAGGPDIEIVSSILLEAAAWLESLGMPMWREDELLPERIESDVTAGLFFVAWCGRERVGTIKFELSDQKFWPDIPEDESVFIHRLAVRRGYAGGGVSSALLSWAIERGVALGRHYARLDCEASRQRLRAVYERFGFRHHSDRQVGPYFVSRYELRLADWQPPSIAV